MFSIHINSESIKLIPYHHMDDGTFRNPEGSPEPDPNKKFSFYTFNNEKRKIEIDIPSNHVIKKEDVHKKLKKIANDDYITWIGHATFLIKLGNTIIITDPYFSENAGPFTFGPKRYINPSIELNDLPKIKQLLLTHKH